MYKCINVQLCYTGISRTLAGGKEEGGGRSGGKLLLGVAGMVCISKGGGGEGSLVYSVSGMLGHDEMMILRIHTCNQENAGCAVGQVCR